MQRKNINGTFCMLILAMLLMGCTKRNPHNVTRGFYYWKTRFAPTDYELDRLSELNCKTVYLRLFDVDWNPSKQLAVPVGTVKLPKDMPAGFSYIPVIFITQKTMDHLSEQNLPDLARNIISYTSQLCAQSNIDPAEIQIDCDWTANNKTIYFALLKAIKAQPFFKGKSLSCTLRMHQAKYLSRSGIPPVDRVLLMCYNMGNIKKYGDHNSILDAEEAEKYLGVIDKYPLPMDIALPLFRWSLLFRNLQLKGIVRDVPEDAIRTSQLFRHKKGNLYTVQKDSFWRGYQLIKHDVIRIEVPTLEDINEVASYTAERIANRNLHVVFFHCDSLTLSKYSGDELETIYMHYN